MLKTWCKTLVYEMRIDQYGQPLAKISSCYATEVENEHLL